VKKWAAEMESRLAEVGATKKALADALGIDPSTLYRWMREDLRPRQRLAVDQALSALGVTMAKKGVDRPSDRPTDQGGGHTTEKRNGAAMARNARMGDVGLRVQRVFQEFLDDYHSPGRHMGHSECLEWMTRLYAAAKPSGEEPPPPPRGSGNTGD
jgi:hypothetical protein